MTAADASAGDSAGGNDADAIAAASAARQSSIFKLTFRLPIILWQSLFFIGPLCFMVAMSFFIVRNYRMQEAFVTKN
jgi:hypothetical protein